MVLVDMVAIGKVSAKFEKKSMEKDVRPGMKNFKHMFNWSMYECERLGLNPFIAYDVNLPDE